MTAEMKKLALTCTVVAALLPAPADAAVPSPDGYACGYSSLTDPTAEEGTQLGEIDGGPIVVADLPRVDVHGDPTLSWDVLGNPASATLTCDLQLNDQTHGGPNTVSLSASGTTVVVLPPTTTSYALSVNDTVHLCTSVTVTDARGDSGTFYWDAWEQEWTTDSTVPCTGLLAPPCCYVPFVGDTSEIVGELFLEVDRIVCAVLDDVFPPEGDIPGLWHCPPYSI